MLKDFGTSLDDLVAQRSKARPAIAEPVAG
jgi:hypothetical protein